MIEINLAIKRCPHCGHTQHVSNFRKRVASLGTFSSWCTPCCREYDLIRGKRPYVRQRQRLASKKYRATAKSRATPRKCPEKTRARSLAQYKFNVSGKCEMCRVADAAHRHHIDYARPLDIVFLCRTCHELADRDPEALDRAMNGSN